ncbi:MBL fold metallo-hydrolase [Streptomyces sp. NBC_01775]|uniref:MBL fold metallo-hydrolase n=1 Tax=Streptomyces sp. NBC_01775 TaxID=2975939 RepID=UPI002DDA9983|nr:MBL fold metallo-hydrolase [Streptomyces sp. NBC_01775]WSB80476.1 MBL fold metallo-hydrolase [Streptomyces sp. NBC_01775]
MEQIELGNITITRVREYYGSVEMTPDTFFPEIPKELWADNAPLLTPHFLEPGTNIVNSAIQTWLLRSEGRTILVDTGVGNHKERPVLDRDIVVNTHLHIDHVGWNTYLDGRSWVPTFPNATYLIPKDDFDFWNPENGHKPLLGRGNQNVFEDSVAPVHQAGQTLLWAGTHQIDAGLRLDAAPGHTPGSSVLTLTSGPDRAVFVGDLLHNPMQILEPDANSCFCEDPSGARATRRRVLGWAADHNALVIPAHLGGHGAAEVVRDGNKFAIKGWSPFSPFTEQD